MTSWRADLLAVEVWVKLELASWMTKQLLNKQVKVVKKVEYDSYSSISVFKQQTWTDMRWICLPTNYTKRREVHWSINENKGRVNAGR